MNAQDESGLSWREDSTLQTWSAADDTRFYRVYEFVNADLFRQEAGWRLVMHSIGSDERQIYYGESRENCQLVAQTIHDGCFTGVLFGPVVIDQLDPTKCRRYCWDFSDGKVTDHYMTLIDTPPSQRAGVALEIHDYELIRDLLETIAEAPEMPVIDPRVKDECMPEIQRVLSKTQQIITRHYAGRSR